MFRQNNLSVSVSIDSGRQCMGFLVAKALLSLLQSALQATVFAWPTRWWLLTTRYSHSTRLPFAGVGVWPRSHLKNWQEWGWRLMGQCGRNFPVRRWVSLFCNRCLWLMDSWTKCIQMCGAGYGGKFLVHELNLTAAKLKAPCGQMPRCGTRDVALVSVGRNLDTIFEKCLVVT